MCRGIQGTVSYRCARNRAAPAARPSSSARDPFGKDRLRDDANHTRQGPEKAPLRASMVTLQSAFPFWRSLARMLRGEPLELVARETNVSIAMLSEWRERALAGAATALKARERDDRDDEIALLKSKVGEITMDNELL